MIARKVGRPVKLKLSVSYEWFICSINPWQCLLQRMLSFFACWQRTIDENAYFEEGHIDCQKKTARLTVSLGISSKA